MGSLLVKSGRALVLTTTLVSGVAIDQMHAEGIEAKDLQSAYCQGSNDNIHVAVGWPIEKAEKLSPELAKPATPGIDSGLATYVSHPAILSYEGEVGLKFECPRLVVINGKRGVISYAEVNLDSTDPMSMHKAISLAKFWQTKLVDMKLDDLSKDKSQHVTSYEALEKFFATLNGTQFLTIGKTIGAWRKGDERISVGVERWNISPSTFDSPKYIYITDIVISKYKPAN